MRYQTIFVILLVLFSLMLVAFMLNAEGKYKFPKSLYQRKFEKQDDHLKIIDLKRSIETIEGMPKEHAYRHARLLKELNRSLNILLEKQNYQ